MTLNQVASAIAKREGKKSQARIGDIREILKIYFDLRNEGGDSFCDMENREEDKRNKKKAKKK